VSHTQFWQVARRLLGIVEGITYQPPLEPTDTSLKKVFDEIQEFVRTHPGARVLSADNPRWGFLGWVAYVDGTATTPEIYQYWTIALRSARDRMFLIGFTEDQQTMIQEAFRTGQGRQRLIEALISSA
jgi:hypothetical protein